ncbi:M20 family metallopeptidase [Planctomicrobium sp. SH661]|uniref:M20 family metallopeptidase n=1 Tax=Planctomicrobium sp. SH661 TaxID=3448124 RepID=UPI003F5C05FB
MSLPLKSQDVAVATLARPTAELTDPLKILQELIAIPSVNPMGQPVSGPIYFEGRISDWLVDFFERLDVPFERQEVFPGRHNIIARFDSPGATRTIMLDAHQDTVPVEGMTVEPFTPTIRNGRLYGRGSCDVKGGMASMLAAFARLVIERPLNATNVLLACTCDEEFATTGARHLAQSWKKPAESLALMPTPPDFCLVAEPTELNAVVAHKGAVRWKLKTTGRACHSSRPHDGVNAIYKMAEIVQLLQVYANELSAMPPHPLCGSPSLSVGCISGGTSVNIVPDECVIEIDRRVIPGEDPEQVIPKLTAWLSARTDTDFEMSPSWVDGATLSDEDNSEWASRLMEHVADVAGLRRQHGAWYGTNAAQYSMRGVPAIVLGPGSIAQAHTVDEWIEIAQLHQASEIYYRFCLD